MRQYTRNPYPFHDGTVQVASSQPTHVNLSLRYPAALFISRESQTASPGMSTMQFLALVAFTCVMLVAVLGH